MTAPRWEDVPEESRELATVHLVRARERFRKSAAQWAKRGHSRNVSLTMHAVNAIDAALARLAEPAQSSAAERWRRVPERARAAKLSELSDDVTIYSASPDCDTDGIPYADHAEASRALLALAREAERSGA